MWSSRPVQFETGTRERHASWLELSFDLVLVVAIAQLAHLFAHHPDGHGAFVAANREDNEPPCQNIPGHINDEKSGLSLLAAFGLDLTDPVDLWRT